MKKKLMMVTLLLAGLSMGACVDDKESASVTAVREAKTEQLDALAAMNNAAAEARKAMATAEAALIKAEAEAKQAAAELQKANAEIAQKQAELDALENEEKNLQNQELQAKLEKELAELEVYKKTAEQTLAQLDAEMQQNEILAQQAMVVAQQQLALAEKAMVNYEKQLAVAKTQEEKNRLDAEKRELQRLSQVYITAVDKLNNAKNSLMYLRRNLVSAENQLTSLEEGKDAVIAQKKSQIAQYEMEITKYKEYVNYTDDLESLKASYNKLQGDYNLAFDNSKATANHYNDMWNLKTPDADTLDLKIKNDKFYQFAIRHRNIDEEGNTTSLQWPISTYLPWINNGKVRLYYNYQDENIVASPVAIGDSLYCDPVEFTTDIRVVELEVTKRIADLNSWLETAQKNLKDFQNAYDGKATKGLYPYYATVVDAQGQTVPSEEPCTNIKDSIASLKKSYEEETDPAVKTSLRSKYETFLGYESTALSQITRYSSLVDDYTAAIPQLKDQWEMYQKYDENMAALQKQFDARNKKQLEELAVKVDAWYAMQKAKSALQAVQAQKNAVDLMLNGQYAVDLDGNTVLLDGAAAIAKEIKTREEQIAKLKEQLEDFSNITTQEELVEQYKVEIAAQEALIKAYEIAVEDAKADLEAAMAKAAGTDTEE